MSSVIVPLHAKKNPATNYVHLSEEPNDSMRTMDTGRERMDLTVQFIR